MAPFSKIESTVIRTGHRSLLAALCFMIVISPFLPESGALSWLFAAMLMVILLAAARTIVEIERHQHPAQRDHDCEQLTESQVEQAREILQSEKKQEQ